MNKIIVNKEDLLAKIRENRETHSRIAGEAKAAYQDQLTKALGLAHDDALSGKFPVTTNFDTQLPPPHDYTKEYDKAIGMLEMHVEENIELEQDEYAQYVQDEWYWKSRFVAANSTYTVVK